MTELSPNVGGERLDALSASHIERELRAAYDDTAGLPITAPGPLPSPPRRPPWVAPTAAAAAVALLVGGVYVASHVAHPDAAPAPAAPTTAPTPVPQGATVTLPPSPLPGAATLERIGSVITRDASGSTTIDIGAPPAGANAVHIEWACRSAGTIEIIGVGSSGCDDKADPDPRGGASYDETRFLGQRTFTVEGTAAYRLWLYYERKTIVPLATNARGQTYGTGAEGLRPDLVATIATNGRLGYVLRTEWEPPMPTTSRSPVTSNPPARTIPVYESDGVTVIGEFTVGGGHVQSGDVPPWAADPSRKAPNAPIRSALPSPGG